MLSDFIALSYIIINQKVARLGSAATAPQGERFCRTNRSLSDKNTARYRRATVWIGHKTFPRNSSKSAFRNQGIFPANGCRCVATRQGDAGRVPPQGRAALRVQYYDDSEKWKSLLSLLSHT
ncbi:MAG TPA: hypothetical protein PKZ47_08735 [Alistipes sp.]|nr:hypothetical protein [Alistipes sp.]